MEISSKEDFKVAFDKIPDYKIRKEKVSCVVVKVKLGQDIGSLGG